MTMRNANNSPEYRIPVQVVETQKTPVQPDELVEEEPVNADAVSTSPQDEIDWKALAIRLQADMSNFRKRQTRRADEAVTAERARLLGLTLEMSDNLARVLGQDESGTPGLLEGIELTYREMMRQLEMEGVTRINAVGQPFSPDWHEALATTPSDAAPGIVVAEIQSGYKLDGKLLRPSKVVVAA